MPGHKGKTELEKYDITEIYGADYLHDSNGIIKESENNASKLFNSKLTLYSTEGSSTVIKAMCYLALLETKKKKILATRNAHKSFLDSSILLDFDIDWINNCVFDNICSCNIDYIDLENKLKNNEYAALYITSPDYLGNMLDIKKISNIAKKYNVMVLQDNAHGSYLRFLDKGLHPLECDVDMCSDSAHKTIKCLTGGAYLHINYKCSKKICENAKRALSIFSSTSPSYLILESLDLCNVQLENERQILSVLIPKLERTKDKLQKYGYEFVTSDPLKITINTKRFGYLGNDFASILRNNDIECEYSDPDYVVLMVTNLNYDEEISYLENVLINIPRKTEISKTFHKYYLPKKIMSTKEASTKDTCFVNIDDSQGRIVGYGNIICPPAISVVVPGEEIGKEHIDIMKYYGYEKICVVNE